MSAHLQPTGLSCGGQGGCLQSCGGVWLVLLQLQELDQQQSSVCSEYALLLKDGTFWQN